MLDIMRSFLSENYPAFLNIYIKTSKIPSASSTVKQEKNNGIMDRFFSRINQKVNLGRHSTPAHLDITILKDGFLNNQSKK